MPGDLPTHFGKLYRNLHSLEFVLRLRIYRHENRNDPDREAKEGNDMQALANAKVGDVIDQNWLCKSAHFSEVLKAYNTAFPNDQSDRKKLCDIRNALSHAKFLFNDPELPGIGINTVLLDSELTVTFREELNEAWYNEQIQYVAGILQEVKEKL